MAEAEFSTQGVTLRLSKEEWWFVTSSMSYVLYGRRLPDHDFCNTLMMDSADAERLVEELGDAEGRAQAAGSHWNPRSAS
jgi:hypothetical protein